MFPCITLLILSLIEFLGIRFLEQKPDMDQKYQRMKEKEMEEKKHKKRADHFPGKYPKEFYQIMQDYIRYYWKEQIIAFSGAAMIAAVTQDGSGGFSDGEGTVSNRRDIQYAYRRRPIQDVSKSGDDPSGDFCIYDVYDLFLVYTRAAAVFLSACDPGNPKEDSVFDFSV